MVASNVSSEVLVLLKELAPAAAFKFLVFDPFEEDPYYYFKLVPTPLCIWLYPAVDYNIVSFIPSS